jgi:hypothetical protein
MHVTRAIMPPLHSCRKCLLTRTEGVKSDLTYMNANFSFVSQPSSELRKATIVLRHLKEINCFQENLTQRLGSWFHPISIRIKVSKSYV